ncbi:MULTISPECIES: NAD(P)-dependent oxidoreductase [unclassified Lentimicrobium]|uniref:NAD(P)-dependent oxidoreductase n=1 Tax=unclassified Lentimicrobium TaxID=2677434 RepID=UPI001553B17A|nr:MULTISPECIES: NAD(P)-dependent oxidoreductase [unclassified Lentimicrobium]NPD44479.1 hydroxyacid dehydrogenase [Lentimicrobium sp. S6]NPD84221.1 hydroxyacid dehydrogenase [Lentimicrobium sp. L6]
MKVLFIDTTHEILPQELEEMGFQCDYFDDYKYQDYLNCIADYDGVVIRSKIKMDKHILKQAKKLKFIGRVGAGMENIDVEFAQSLGIACLNSPEGNRDAVAEHALGMILALRNHLVRVNQEVRNGIWIREENRGFELKGKTLAIIGYGNMGRAFAQRLLGFEMKVIAYDKYKSNFSDEYAQEVALEEVFKQADVISYHVPLTEETRYMFNDEFISQMNKPFYLINTARGPVVNTADLMKGIEAGQVLGAALDVLEFEGVSFEKLKEEDLPESFQKLISSDQVLLSPHIAGWTMESNIKLSSFIVEKIAALNLL